MTDRAIFDRERDKSLGDNIILLILEKLLCIPGALFAFTFKGFCQAFTSDRLGDPTPRNMGKLTMNPLKHIDIIGFIFIVFFGFGWCRPVQVNSRYYKHIKRDCAIQILSGPVGCLVGGFGMALLYVLFCGLFNVEIGEMLTTTSSAASFISFIFYYGMRLCVFLCLFYMLPIPGFDGFNLIANFLPPRAYSAVYSIQKYSMFIFIGVILLINYTPLGTYILYIPANAIMNGFLRVWLSVFGFLF